MGRRSADTVAEGIAHIRVVWSHLRCGAGVFIGGDCRSGRGRRVIHRGHRDIDGHGAAQAAIVGDLDGKAVRAIVIESGGIAGQAIGIDAGAAMGRRSADTVAEGITQIRVVGRHLAGTSRVFCRVDVGGAGLWRLVQAGALQNSAEITDRNCHGGITEDAIETIDRMGVA